LGAWHSRFHTPTPDELLADLPKETRPVVQAAVEHLGKRHRVAWRGIPWRWTITPDRITPAMFVVPDPVRPLMAARIPTAYLAEHPPANMPKPVRDAISSAACVGGGVWAEWHLTSLTTLELVMELVREAHPS
jgi:hypothetical protein